MTPPARDGLGLPGKNNRHLGGHPLGYVDVHEIDVKQRAVDRVPLHLADEADVAFRAPSTTTSTGMLAPASVTTFRSVAPDA